jgi:DNA (cytosine-5)-methyltransferase 1
MTKKHQLIKYIDLFCGMGSFHYSFQKLGFKCVMASDIYKPARDNYKENFGINVLGDICDIDPTTIDNYDILCAGFPCQPFSQAGKHKGFKDSRGTMFSQVMKFVKLNVPKIVEWDRKIFDFSIDTNNFYKGRNLR